MKYTKQLELTYTKQSQKEILEPKKTLTGQLINWMIATLNQPGNPL